MVEADNPFNTQQASGQGLVSKAMKTSSKSAYTPYTQELDRNTETVQGQVGSILSRDSPLMQRARALATQQMAQRGLVNSSMAQGAGVGAMTDRAMDIGSRDAAAYQARSAANIEAENRARQQDAEEEHQLTLQRDQQQFSATERAASEVFQNKYLQAQQYFTAAQSELDRALQVSQTDKSIGANQALQNAQQTFQGAQADLDRAQQSALADKQTRANEALQNGQQQFQAGQQTNQQEFQAAQAGLDRENQKLLMTFQNTLNNGNVSQAFAANTASATLSAINALQGDPNLDPVAKKFAIENVIASGNASLRWGAALYNTPLPDMALPVAPSSTPGYYVTPNP